jgi:hypothetical protein
MKFYMALALILVAALPGLAADVDGKWTGTLSAGGGDFPVEFNFKAEDTKLTGSTLGMDGAPIAIQDGKVDGSNIAFTVSFDFAGMPLVISYKGVVADGQIKFVADVFGMTLEFVVKKQV